MVENHWQEGIAGLPIAQSSVIIIGEALSANTHLSNNKNGVYTEFSVRINEILKSDNPALIPNSILSVDRPGGFVRYPDGHKLLYRIFGLNMLRVNKHYLLFLDNTEQSPNYQVLTGYEMTANGISPIDVAPQFDAYKGMDGISFAQTVRDAIKQNSQTSSQ
ncbi:MAG TPA: hypothetical protein VLJ61_14750 [Pyrinomonadaceae bacterium]|nr:hypothetical protein [Pyrinomonadaceae bacterium]